MPQTATVLIYTARCSDGVHLSDMGLREHPFSRATRLVGDSTRFLLVSVGKKADDRALRETLLRWTHQGIELNGIRYRFLGFTEAQVKEGKLMFFHEDHEWTVQRLLSSLGNLSAVFLSYGYGKYSARLGLSFSSTMESVDIPDDAAVQIQDLVAADGSLHSDGCGMMRDSFAQRLCAIHNLPGDTTVFQIRRGGIKGVIVRYPDETFDRLCKTTSPSVVIAYRPSMLKYDGGPTNLEINNYNSAPAPARLNFQFMVLLLTLGVPVAVFQRLLQAELDMIGTISVDREKALQYIKGELDAGREDDFSQSIYEMLLAPQDLSEPYVARKLQQFQKSQYEHLRRKMSLRVANSCYLYGVLDEEGVLGPNEVYINLPARSGVLVQDVIVGRNPAHHPGDIRKLRAVDHPLLRHHRNCIVFPRTAPHSVPDTIASGDLDGDVYFISWEPALLPPQATKPLSRGLSSSATQTNGRPLQSRSRQVSNMAQAAVETFIQFKFNRLLGEISNEWSRQVERTPLLAAAEFPLKLVPLIESALDIMKSGEDFAKLEEEYRKLKSQHRVVNVGPYQSPIQMLRNMIPNPTVSGPGVYQCDPCLILKDTYPRLWQQMIEEASSVMPRYNDQLCCAIQLDHETASRTSLPWINETIGSHHDPHHYREPKQADRLRRTFQDQYFGGGSWRDLERQRVRASAWYWYGYSKNKEAFAWLGERYLNEIKAGKCYL
ncbi:RdRP-domain-containing protein [Trametes punicea]|nr:RdRP-domain-containing protein [Trametes punicea]